VTDSPVTLSGNLTRDPELRFTTNGTALATFGLAVNRRKKVGDTWEDEVSFFDVVAWQTLAENVAESLTKGTRVVVTGSLTQRSWETDSGETRSRVEVVAAEVGPSLRWASATVDRNERRTPTGGTGGGFRPGEEPF
jgi:single-strand DNA-binding protein